jgi:hypothetical protein
MAAELVKLARKKKRMVFEQIALAGEFEFLAAEQKTLGRTG